jgi:hypothetical protein
MLAFGMAFQRIPFNDLPPVVRERLARSLGEENDRGAIRWWRGHHDSLVGRIIFAVIATGGTGYLMNWLNIEDARKDPWFERELYLLLAGTSFIAIAAILGIVFRLIWKPPAWKWGVQFITGGHAVWVGRGTVEAVPVAQLTSPVITNHYRNGTYQRATVDFAFEGRRLGPHFRYSLGSKAEAEELLAALSAAGKRYQDAVMRRNEPLLRDLDPFAECTITGQWRSAIAGGPKVAMPSLAIRLGGWLAALALGAGLAGGYYQALSARCQTIPKCPRGTRY